MEFFKYDFGTTFHNFMHDIISKKKKSSPMKSDYDISLGGKTHVQKSAA